MHVFLITQYFPPEIGAAATRWGDYTDILVKQGHRVTVLCEMPNYPQGIYFPGYKRQWVKREYISPNFTIIRSFTWATDRKSVIKKLGNLEIFPLKCKNQFNLNRNCHIDDCHHQLLAVS